MPTAQQRVRGVSTPFDQSSFSSENVTGPQRSGFSFSRSTL